MHHSTVLSYYLYNNYLPFFLRCRPVELAQCLYCAEDYPLTELVLHVESCDKKKVHEREIEASIYVYK